MTTLKSNGRCTRIGYSSTVQKARGIVGRHPVASYFVLTFAISWIGALLVAAPHLMRREPLPKLTGILMFPAMLLGPCLAGLTLARITGGEDGIWDLFSGMCRWRFPARWYAALFIPPVLVLAVLFLLETFVSPVYAPNRFLAGIWFGVPAGFLEEIGWIGYAFPKMRLQEDAFAPSMLLGLLWASWHLPVINYLGTATPHGAYWYAFFLAFTVAMTAMRVLICWVYSNTQSVLAAQFMHVSSTGSLVIFSAPRVSGAQEALWYGLYGISLWAVVAIVAKTYGRRLTRSCSP